MGGGEPRRVSFPSFFPRNLWKRVTTEPRFARSSIQDRDARASGASATSKTTVNPAKKTASSVRFALHFAWRFPSCFTWLRASLRASLRFALQFASRSTSPRASLSPRTSLRFALHFDGRCYRTLGRRRRGGGARVDVVAESLIVSASSRARTPISPCLTARWISR